MYLRERLVGLLLVAFGLAVLFLLYAFWRSGFQTPVQPPLPATMDRRLAFAFNPVVCAMPFMALAAFGFIFEGIRRLIHPEDTLV